MTLLAIAKSPTIGTMRLDQKLQKLCDEQGLDSQRDLARLAKLSKSSVGRWVNGESRPRMHQALKLARALGVPLEYLIDDAMEEVPPRLLPDEQFVLKVYRNLKADPSQGLDEDEAQRRLCRPSPAQAKPVQPKVVPEPGLTPKDVAARKAEAEAARKRATNGEMPKKPKPGTG